MLPYTLNRALQLTFLSFCVVRAVVTTMNAKKMVTVPYQRQTFLRDEGTLKALNWTVQEDSSVLNWRLCPA